MRRNATKTFTGCVRVVSSAPLGADLYRAVKEMEEERPGLFGKFGATGQVFSLYTMASAAGVFLGPLWTQYAYGHQSWTFLVSSLGGLCASVAVLLVHHPSIRPWALWVYANNVYNDRLCRATLEPEKSVRLHQTPPEKRL